MVCLTLTSCGKGGEEWARADTFLAGDLHFKGRSTKVLGTNRYEISPPPSFSSGGPHSNPSDRIERETKKTAAQKRGPHPTKGKGGASPDQAVRRYNNAIFLFFFLPSLVYIVVFLAIICLLPFLGGHWSPSCSGSTVEYALPPTSSQPEPFCGLSCWTKPVPMHSEAAGNGRRAA